MHNIPHLIGFASVFLMAEVLPYDPNELGSATTQQIVNTLDLMLEFVERYQKFNDDFFVGPDRDINPFNSTLQTLMQKVWMPPPQSCQILPNADIFRVHPLDPVLDQIEIWRGFFVFVTPSMSR